MTRSKSGAGVTCTPAVENALGTAWGMRMAERGPPVPEMGSHGTRGGGSTRPAYTVSTVSGACDPPPAPPPILIPLVPSDDGVRMSWEEEEGGSGRRNYGTCRVVVPAPAEAMPAERPVLLSLPGRNWKEPENPLLACEAAATAAAAAAAAASSGVRPSSAWNSRLRLLPTACAAPRPVGDKSETRTWLDTASDLGFAARRTLTLVRMGRSSIGICNVPVTSEPASSSVPGSNGGRPPCPVEIPSSPAMRGICENSDARALLHAVIKSKK